MLDEQSIEDQQKAICRKYGVDFSTCSTDLKVGIALNVRDGIQPINGLRHPPKGDTTGWYLWAGEEWSDRDDFFKPLHVAHLTDWCPIVLPFLGLPAGWRFLIASDHEDVWYDEALLGV